MKVPKILAAGLIAATFDNVHARHLKRDVPRQDLQYEAHNFQQKINHFPHNKLPFADKTFTQRYYFDSSYYKPGQRCSICHLSRFTDKEKADQCTFILVGKRVVSSPRADVAGDGHGNAVHMLTHRTRRAQ